MSMDILNEYRELNLQIIQSIKDDKEDVKLLEEREEIIKKILSIDIDKDEMKRLYVEMGLKEIDMELEKTLKEKMLYVKNSIKKMAASRQANKRYIDVNRGQNFFSTKI